MRYLTFMKDYSDFMFRVKQSKMIDTRSLQNNRN